MKARLIETGEWLTVNPCDDGFYDVETHNIYDADELDFSRGFDWEIFRREAAKDILAGLMQHRVLSDASDRLYIPKEQVVSAAIGLADELIKQLKEGKK